MLLVNIDSGSGTTILMERFLREFGGKKTCDAMLVAQSKLVKSHFRFSLVYFRILSNKSDGVVVKGKNICSIPLLIRI